MVQAAQKHKMNVQATPALLDGLNQALNREVSTMLRYMVQAASLKGVEWQGLRDTYLDEVDDELGHAQYLANKIVMLGGEPDLTPELPDVSRTEPRTMIESDVEEERRDVRLYEKLAGEADSQGLIELQLKMEEQAADEARHAEQLSRMLG